MLYSPDLHDVTSEAVLSPILVRPVREQLEHDRVIRQLQAKYKRKFDVGMNAGAEQSAGIGTGTSAVYPDLVLHSTERGRKLLGVVEVETSESVNHLEAMSQWASFARLRAPLHLYVPAGSIDTARRLCADHQIPVAEIWTYHPIGDQMRFTLVHRAQQAPEREPRPAVERPSRPAPERAPRPTTAAAAAAPPRALGRRPAASPTARRKPPTAGKPRAQAASRKPAKKVAPARSARTQKRR
jgi:hypothetical protein